MKNLMLKLWKEEEGATIIEYVLLAALVSIVAVVAIRQIGANVNTQYGKVESAVPAN
ncbi:MAG TPA: Flp family type IVb pilin [Armatimonadota bacterium]|jgi:pilus assembly protein Flp/PilA